MVKRPTEKQTEFPVLEIIGHPFGFHPISVVMEPDWYKTGEVSLSYTTAQSLEDFLRLLDYARNYMADELLEARKVEKKWLKAENEGDPPF